MVISGLIMGLPYHLDEHCYPETTRVRFAMHRKILNLINFLQRFNFLQMPQFSSLTSAQPSVAAAHLLRLEISPNFTSYYTFYFPALHICTLVTKMNVNIFLFILQEWRRWAGFLFLGGEGKSKCFYQNLFFLSFRSGERSCHWWHPPCSTLLHWFDGEMILWDKRN